MSDEKTGCAILIIAAIVLGWLTVGVCLVGMFAWQITPPHIRPVVAVLFVIAVILNTMRGGQK